MTLLKELISRYDRWVNGGGVRASIAGPLDWEEEEAAACVRAAYSPRYSPADGNQ